MIEYHGVLFKTWWELTREEQKAVHLDWYNYPTILPEDEEYMSGYCYHYYGPERVWYSIHPSAGEVVICEVEDTSVNWINEGF